MVEKAQVGDIEMHYQMTGEGFPLVMIAGFTANMDNWEPALLEQLSEHYRVLVFDNRGAGRTEGPGGTFTMKQFGDDTAGLMDALGIERAYVLGESMGGMIAQEAVLNHPEKVEKLVLCCTFCGGEEAVFPPSEVIEIMADRTGTPEEIARRGLQILFPEDFVDNNQKFIDDFINRTLEHPISEENAERQAEAIFGFSAYDRLPQIKCPTLVANGTADVIIAPVNSKTLTERIPGAKHIEFEGGGHGFPMQFRDEFVSALREFLG